jgi:hypothetical protein
MLDMTNDSHLFRTRDQLVAEGFYEDAADAGHVFTKGDVKFLPLYEGKLVQHYNHRAASIAVNPDNLHRPANEVTTPPGDLANPDYSPEFQFWVDRKHVANGNRGWLLGYKDITAPTNARTMIACAIPVAAVGNTFCLIHAAPDKPAACLLANLSSFALDYVARQKVGGQHLNFFIVEQLPVIPPERYDDTWHSVNLNDFVSKRALELCYTARDLQGLAADLGYDGPPFPWDEERRLHLRCQLDAMYFHLYGLTRDEAGEILDTFPIVRRQDEARYDGRFRTRELILGYHNAYAAGNMDARVRG